MENRYHKVVDLDPVLNWSRKKLWWAWVRAKTDPHWQKKKVVIITEIKTQEYHVNLHLLLIYFDKHSPTLGGP